MILKEVNSITLSRFQSELVGSTRLAFLLDSVGMRYVLPFTRMVLFLTCIYWIVPYIKVFFKAPETDKASLK